MGGSERPLHDTGNHCPVEPYSPRRAARRGDLTNPAQTGEGGDQVKLVTPRWGTRPFIVHSSVRTAHFRDTFSDLVEILFTEVIQKLADPLWAKNRFGLEKLNKNSIFYKKISETLTKEKTPIVSQQGLIEILFEIANNKFDEFHHKMVDGMKFLGEKNFIINSIVEAHNNALASSQEPNERIEKLKKFQWKIYKSKKMQFLLPDCVTITISEKGSAQPYIWHDLFDDCFAYAIVAPLSRNCLLVGYQKFIPKFENLNAHFASCSDDFFVTPDRKHSRFAGNIGQWSNRITDPFIASLMPF